MARVTRLELATSGVTGRRSNQLSYTPLKGYILDKDRYTIGQGKINIKEVYLLINFVFKNRYKIKKFRKYKKLN